MAKKWWKLPTREEIESKPSLRILRPIIKHPEFWSLHHNNLTRAVFIGVFVSFIPIPFQMFLAIVLSIPFRANIILSTSLVWISNPITIPPMLYGCYHLGRWILNEHTVINKQIQESLLHALFTSPGTILKPLIIGSSVAGFICASLCALLFYVIWRLWSLYKQHLSSKQTH